MCSFTLLQLVTWSETFTTRRGRWVDLGLDDESSLMAPHLHYPAWPLGRLGDPFNFTARRGRWADLTRTTLHRKTGMMAAISNSTSSTTISGYQYFNSNNIITRLRTSQDITINTVQEYRSNFEGNSPTWKFRSRSNFTGNSPPNSSWTLYKLHESSHPEQFMHFTGNSWLRDRWFNVSWGGKLWHIRHKKRQFLRHINVLEPFQDSKSPEIYTS